MGANNVTNRSNNYEFVRVLADPKKRKLVGSRFNGPFKMAGDVKKGRLAVIYNRKGTPFRTHLYSRDVVGPKGITVEYYAKINDLRDEKNKFDTTKRRLTPGG